MLEFRYRPTSGAPPDHVALHGEASTWLEGIPMQRRDDGAFVAHVDLPTGIYAYKLVIDGEWELDPDNPRTRTNDGYRNNVVVVDGADEPFLHAPASPYVDMPEGGGLRIVVAVRHGARGVPVVRYSESNGPLGSASPMACVDDEGEHSIYEVRIPTSVDHVRYAIELQEDERVTAATPTFDYVRPTADAPLPAWWRDAVLYTIYVDRFRPAVDSEAWNHDPGPNVAAGGHLDGITRSLPELSDLGINALYLTPIHVGQSSHRYDLVDPSRVDPALGGELAFARLVNAARSREIRIIVDISFAHVGLAFPPCADVLEWGAISKYADWFLWSKPRDGGPATLRHYDRRDDAPLSNLAHPEVRALVLATVDQWAARGVDGLRIDMAAEMPLPLLREIRRVFRAKRPEGVVFGELVPAHAWRWRNAGALDAATDFEFHETVRNLVATGTLAPADAIRKLSAHTRARGGADDTHVRFVATHDHARLMTVATANARAAYVPIAYSILFAMPGIPALLYGEEIGLQAPSLDTEIENAWGDRAPMPWQPKRRDEALRTFVRALIALRHRSPALRHGSFELLHADESRLVWRREAAGECLDIAVNLGREAVVLELSDDEPAPLEIVVSHGEARAEGEALFLGVAAVALARRVRPRARSSPQRAAQSLLIRDREFAFARTKLVSRPTRIDFAITERCNLRCAHCITDAPARTRDGTARTLRPWLLERLRRDLGEASYFGFVHGGESMSAPIFYDVLDAIGEERGARPFMAHLLTNGILLGEDAARRLVSKGVRSISVSLDGATAETNDAIRTGGRFDRIVANLKAVARFRSDENVDLRLGISFVILRSNLGEVGRIVELAAALGVDWVKLEEAVPNNDFTRRSLIHASDHAVRDAVAHAESCAGALGIRLVDHTLERPIWRCRLGENAADARFLVADEFANRSEIHPCRGPWEIACIEPNGDVRAGHFFGDVLGNLATSTLPEIWNGAVAQSDRSRAHEARICGRTGPVTCVVT